MMNRSYSIALALVVAAGSAATSRADTITGYVTSIYHGLGNNEHGGFGHEFWAGSGAAAAYNTGTSQATASSVYTFCTDPNYLNNSSGFVGNTYTLIGVQDAPWHSTGNAGPAYTAAQESAVNAIALAALQLGIMDGRGFVSSLFTTNGDVISGTHANGPADNVTLAGHTLSKASWIEGTQNLIWRALGGLLTTDAGGTVTAAEGYIAAVAAGYSNAAIRVRVLGVDAGSNQGQDQLVLSPDGPPLLVPLPPAGYAGLGTLGAVFGLGYARRRRHASV